MTVEQIENYAGKLTTIDMGFMSKAQGDKLASILNGKTYMNFEVIVAPAGGDCKVDVQSQYDAPADEILGMLLCEMAYQLIK